MKVGQLGGLLNAVIFNSCPHVSLKWWVSMPEVSLWQVIYNPAFDSGLSR